MLIFDFYSKFQFNHRILQENWLIFVKTFDQLNPTRFHYPNQTSINLKTNLNLPIIMMTFQTPINATLFYPRTKKKTLDNNRRKKKKQQEEYPNYVRRHNN